jgi:hypothetical protein
MGAGASAQEGSNEESPSFDYDALLEKEVNLPLDAADVQDRDLEDVKAEMAGLRTLFARTQNAREVDKQNRLDILSQKMDHHSFRGGSLNTMLKQASTVSAVLRGEGGGGGGNGSFSMVDWLLLSCPPSFLSSFLAHPFTHTSSPPILVR